MNSVFGKGRLHPTQGEHLNIRLRAALYLLFFTSNTEAEHAVKWYQDKVRKTLTEHAKLEAEEGKNILLCSKGAGRIRSTTICVRRLVLNMAGECGCHMSGVLGRLYKNSGPSCSAPEPSSSRCNIIYNCQPQRWLWGFCRDSSEPQIWILLEISSFLVITTSWR